MLDGPVGNPWVWIGLEGLAWWTKNQPLPIPIVTTGPGSEGPNAGNAGMPGTTSLNQPLNYGATGGFRMYAGGWFDPDHVIGMDGSFFVLGTQSAGFGVADRSQAGDLVINEPVAGAPFVTQVSAPGVETGNVNVSANSRFYGVDLDLLVNVCRCNNWTVNLLGGYRHLQLNEALNITANSNLFTTSVYTDNMGNVLATAPPGSAVTVIDQFNAHNAFNGGQIGTSVQYVWGRLIVSGRARSRSARRMRWSRSTAAPTFSPSTPRRST